MVAQDERPLVHTDFLDLPNHLRAGDLLIVNASATIPAALPARRSDGSAVDLHLSTPDPSHADRWVVELRRDGRRARARAETLDAPGGRPRELLAPYLSPGRLWVARLDLPSRCTTTCAPTAPRSATPTTPSRAPLEDYQTIFATEPGSAEMPSAGRPFTKRALQAAARARHPRPADHAPHRRQLAGARRAPVPGALQRPRAHGRAGSTRRAPPAAASSPSARPSCARSRPSPRRTARVHADAGWTSLVVTPERGVRAVDGLLTGWHEPDASHLLMLEAIAGKPLLERSYAAALARGYRWHEFGDLHLLLR